MNAPVATSTDKTTPNTRPRHDAPADWDRVGQLAHNHQETVATPNLPTLPTIGRIFVVGLALSVFVVSGLAFSATTPAHSGKTILDRSAHTVETRLRPVE